MRAGVFLDALEQDFAVTLLVVPVAGGPGRANSRYAAERASRIVTVSPDGKVDPLWTLTGRIGDPDARAAAFASYPHPAMCRHATAPYRSELLAALHGERFDAVHVMRSYMAPYAEPLISGAGERAAPFASLDLDDDEAATHRRMAAVAERAGALDDMRFLAAEAAKFERLERLWLPRFQLLIACSDAHAQKLAADHPMSAIAVVANTVALPPAVPRRRGRRAHILFVGNLSYLPNVDGIRWFVRDVWPRLRAQRGDAIALRIAGSAPAAAVTALAGLPGVELVADPADVAECYAWADLAVVPLAAGGGTRIKLLEAFAHRVPVVATSIGAEGVAATHGVHLLIADTPTAFADACAQVLADDGLGARLAAAARLLVEADYAHARGVRCIRDAFERHQSA
jgi:glycosyltransferase involved in cell wall biosynthesis